jgi:hypothetical protein
MSTYAFFELPSSAADALEHASLWFERVPDLGNELVDEPHNFFAEVGITLSVVANTADVITVSVAVRDIARALRNLYNHYLGKQDSNVVIEVRGPRGKVKFEVERPDDETIAHMAAIVSALASSAIATHQGKAIPPPSHH